MCVGHVPYEDILFSSRYLEGALLTYLRRRNLVAPNKDPLGRERFNEIKGDESKFSGAYAGAQITVNTSGCLTWIALISIYYYVHQCYF